MRGVPSIGLEITEEDQAALDILVIFEEASRQQGGTWSPRVGAYGAYRPGSELQLQLEDPLPPHRGVL
jgi:hypothetical protein